MKEIVKIEIFKNQKEDNAIFNPNFFSSDPIKKLQLKRDSLISNNNGIITIVDDYSQKSKIIDENILFSLEFSSKNIVELQKIKNVSSYHLLHSNYLEKPLKNYLEEKMEILCGKFVFKVAYMNRIEKENGLKRLFKNNISLPEPEEECKDISFYSTEKSNICRFCLEHESENDQLVSPCKCIGSMKLIHWNCLKEWILSKLQVIGNNQVVSLIPKKALTCEICKTKFPWKMKIMGKEVELLVKNSLNNPYLVLESDVDSIYFLLDFSSVSKIKIGRANEADLQLNDISVSRKQFNILFSDGKFYVVDKGSKFGTLIKSYKPIFEIKDKLCLLVQNYIYKFSIEKKFSFTKYFGEEINNLGCCANEKYDSKSESIYKNRHNTEIQ